MNELKQQAIDYIDQNAEQYIDLSHQIWEFAELSLKEFKSAEVLEKALIANGFELKTGLADIETAFSGSFTVGEGGPVIGILGEFDALSALSQKACAVTKESGDQQDGSGHGCGHNMLGAASLGAACAIKDYLVKTNTPGTVIYFGCPGEEGGAAKAFLGREKEWEKLDAALTWHPGDTNSVSTGTCNSSTQVLYKFKGTAAHAAGNPESGRSALDAVEIMNIGTQYLREHMKSDCRIHYAMIDGGGISPNVVQPTASVLYMVRSVKVHDTIELLKRVDKQAEGAALMTETELERIFVDGTANTVPNSILEKVLFDNMSEIPLPEYTEEELEYAKTLSATCPESNYPLTPGVAHDPEIAKKVKELLGDGSSPLHNFVVPFYSGDDFGPGSTDVGDVSWQTPTAQFNTVTFVKNSPGHSWQNVSCGASSIGDKGLIFAAKILAAGAIDLYENAELLTAAKAEFQKRTAEEKYECPIPEGVAPYVIEA